MNIYIKDMKPEEQLFFYRQAKRAYQTLLSHGWVEPGSDRYSEFMKELADIDEWLAENDPSFNEHANN